MPEGRKIYCDAGEFLCLVGEREECPGRRLPLNAGELSAPALWHLSNGTCHIYTIVMYDNKH